jgi:hypothetical protein
MSLFWNSNMSIGKLIIKLIFLRCCLFLVKKSGGEIKERKWYKIVKRNMAEC